MCFLSEFCLFHKVKSLEWQRLRNDKAAGNVRPSLSQPALTFSVLSSVARWKCYLLCTEVQYSQAEIMKQLAVQQVFSGFKLVFYFWSAGVRMTFFSQLYRIVHRCEEWRRIRKEEIGVCLPHLHGMSVPTVWDFMYFQKCVLRGRRFQCCSLATLDIWLIRTTLNES